MPTPTGGETIAERLTRLRAEQARVRLTIDRAENNGQGFNIAGTAVTQIAYERAVARDKQLGSEIAELELRSAGKRLSMPRLGIEL